MRRVILFAPIIMFSFLFISCCTQKKSKNVQEKPLVSVPGPKVIIYQTEKDYSKLVPVILSGDKKTVISYPDIKDVFFNGELAYPTLLHNGYLLDNRGITENVAFIKLTYEEYSKLQKTPDSEQLFKMLIDKDPLKKMYSCGIKSAYKDIEQELNSKIDTDDFSTFNRIK